MRLEARYPRLTTIGVIGALTLLLALGHLILTRRVVADSGRTDAGAGLRRTRMVVLLAQPVDLSLHDLIGAYRRRWKLFKAPIFSSERDKIVMDFGDALAMVQVVRRPVEDVPLGPIIKASWQWGGASQAVRAHQAYVLVEIESRRGDAVDSLVRLTTVAASVVEVTKGVGVLSMSAGMLIEAGEYLAKSASTSRVQMPTALWVNFLPGSLPARGAVIYTVGLSAIGFRELMLAYDGQSDADALETIAKVVDHIIRKRVMLRQGDALNVSGNIELVASEVVAPWDPSRVAIVLAAALKLASRGLAGGQAGMLNMGFPRTLRA